jgi:hypothetical protein
MIRLMVILATLVITNEDDGDVHLTVSNIIVISLLYSMSNILLVGSWLPTLMCGSL